VHSGFNPRVGEVLLLERDDADAEPLTALVADVVGDEILAELTGPDRVVDPGTMLVSVFAPEALYRVTVTAGYDDDGRLRLAGLRHLETIQRRRWPRREMVMPVSLIPADDAAPIGVLGETVDIGVGGTHVTTERPLPGGTDPLVALTLPDGEVLVLAARVVHATTEPGHCDYRLAFQDLDDRDTAHLAELVTAVPA